MSNLTVMTGVYIFFRGSKEIKTCRALIDLSVKSLYCYTSAWWEEWGLESSTGRPFTSVVNLSLKLLFCINLTL